MFASIQKGKSGFFHIQIILYVGLARLFDHLKSTPEVKGIVSIPPSRGLAPREDQDFAADVFPDHNA